MIGSSILRKSLAKKYVKKFMYLKKILNTEKNKKISKKIFLIKKLDKKIENIDLVVISTPMVNTKK